jgi:hypothetical protein
MPQDMRLSWCKDMASENATWVRATLASYTSRETYKEFLMKKNITIDDVKRILKSDINRTENYDYSFVNNDRDKAYRYYFGQSLGNEREGHSNHISRDVFNAIEEQKAALIQIFSENKNVVFFPPQNKDDFESAQQATNYVNYIFYRQNNGYKIIHDWIHNGLLMKNGIVKSYWCNKTDISTQYFHDITEDELEGLYAQDDLTIREVKQDIKKKEILNEIGQVELATYPVYSGEIVKYYDNSKIKIEVLPPEDFLVDSWDYDFDDELGFCAHRKYVTKSDLIEMNFDYELIEKLKGGAWNNQSDSFTSGWREKFERRKGTRGLSGKGNYKDWEYSDSDKTEDQVRVALYECYKKVDLDGDGVSELYQFFWCENHILSHKKVDEHPFSSWSSYMIPHSFYGLSTADILASTQKSKSTVEREMIDNLALTNAGRLLANMALVESPEDLITGRIGGVVNVADINAVKQFPVNPFTPQSFQILEMLEQEKETASGVNRLTQGLNQDVLSKQNSSNMIQAMTKNANKRVMMLAYNFANMGLKRLMQRIYKLAMAYEKKEKFLYLNDKYVTVNPQDLVYRTDMNIDVALTPDQKTSIAQSLLALHNTLKETPSLNLNYGPNEQYFLMDKVMESLEIYSRGNMLLSPNSPEYAQRLQQSQMEVQMQKKGEQDQINLDNQLKVEQLNVLKEQALTERIRIDAKKDDSENKMVADLYKHENDLNYDYSKLEQKDSVDQEKLEIDKKKLK